MLHEGVESKLSAELTPSEKLELIVREQIRFFGENRDFCLIMLREAWGGEERQLEFRKLIRNYMHFISEVIVEGMESGDFEVVNPEYASAGLFGMISISSLHILLSQLPYEEEKLFETMSKMTFGGILKA